MRDDHGPGPKPTSPPPGQTWVDGEWIEMKITREHGDPSDYVWKWLRHDGTLLNKYGKNDNGCGCAILIGVGLLTGIGGGIASLFV